jgi:hypothetical protein
LLATLLHNVPPPRILLARNIRHHHIRGFGEEAAMTGMRGRAPRAAAVALAFAALLGACGGEDAGSPPAAPEDGSMAATAGAAGPYAALLEREIARIQARADSIDAIFQPLPLLRGAEEAEMRRFLNAQQLVAARRLGVQPDLGAADLDRLVAEGRLVRIADSTDVWVVRDLDYSVPLLTPDAVALLQEIGERFQAKLAEIGVPAYRVEVTSVLRSADDQRRLRAVNPNAAAGESTHQYATTFDLAYSAFAPPAQPIVRPEVGDAPWLEPFLLTFAAGAAETVAARRSRELQAILGRELIAMQREGKVMLTLEVLQPVFHMTVARPLAQ